MKVESITQIPIKTFTVLIIFCFFMKESIKFWLLLLVDDYTRLEVEESNAMTLRKKRVVFAGRLTRT